MIKLTQTDGGKIQDGFTNERNDCSVRAFALACNVRYARAHELLKAAGRRDRKGAKVFMLQTAAKAAGIKIEDISIRQPKAQWLGGHSYTNPTLVEVIQRYRDGRYIIITNRHAMALIDGTIHDSGQNSGARSRIKFIYKVTPEIKSGLTPVSQITQSQVNELWERLNQLEAR
jgi:hypothetical protein